MILDMIFGSLPQDSPGVILDEKSIDARLDWTSNVDFSHNGKNFIVVRTPLGHCGIRKALDGLTSRSWHAGATNIHGTAGRINVTTETFRAIRRARQVRLTGIVRNEPVLVNKLVDPGSIASMATTCEREMRENG
jgi:hypothetical protein